MDLKALINKTKFKLEENSPEILLGVSIGTMLWSIVSAAKGTVKAADILEVHKTEMSQIRELRQLSEDASVEEEFRPQYDEKIYKQDLLVTYSKTVIGVAKSYAPAIALGGLSIACVLAARNIMSKRYLGLLAAYNGVTEAFSAYRQRVIDERGEIYDRHYMYGTDLKEVEVTTVDENGKKHKEKEVVEEFDPSKIHIPSAFGFVLDRTNPNWDDNINLLFLMLQGRQIALNDALKSKGHLFLNEAREIFDLPAVPEGQVVGWVDNGQLGDQVLFGVTEKAWEDQKKMYAEGKIDSLLIEFNINPKNAVIINRI